MSYHLENTYTSFKKELISIASVCRPHKTTRLKTVTHNRGASCHSATTQQMPALLRHAGLPQSSVGSVV